jgi:hypothetical protein
MKIENQPNNLDRILLNEDPLLPSSGFATSVMDAIQHESLVPATLPIPFPWSRAVPGFLALLTSLILLGRYAAIALRDLSPGSASDSDWLAWFQSSAQTAVLLRTAAAPALLALAASFLCLILCRRLIFGSRNSSAY